ncbi:MAG: ATP-binding protein [Bryobacteraceae bacterium]
MIEDVADEITVEGAASLQNLMRAAGEHRQTEFAPSDGSFVPSVPHTLDDLGLNATILEQLIVKSLHFRGEVIGRDLAQGLGIKYSIIDPIMESLKRYRLVEVKGSLGFGNISAVFALSEAGRSRAREFLENNQYFGAAPVPIRQYTHAVRAQRLKSGWLTLEALASAYRHMVVTPEIMAQIGPAVNSAKSFLVYGQPGNGKTYLAEALFRLQSEPVYVPYAIECQGTIIKLFDPVYHQPIDEAEASITSLSHDRLYDGRWVRCRRPFIVTGGELSLDMLDLSFNTAARVYDAPFQLKANNGIYLIDDFGRQKATPAEVLNRWIVPMDRRVDYLTFHTGGKVEVPFEAFLIFSTNLRPEQLGDEAFLRRIQYKMLLRNPSEPEFRAIFQQVCGKENLSISAGVLDEFLDRHYKRSAKPFRRCQPRDVISHAVDLIHFEKLPVELTPDVLDRAFTSCFLDTSGMDD